MTKLERKISLQEYLSLGYVYILILGIISDTIYYKFLGINILNYSSVLDVLISPVTLLTRSLLTPIVLVIFIFIMYLWFTKWAAKIHFKYREKKWYRKSYNVEKLDKKYSVPASVNGVISLSAFLILSFYIGLGFGLGRITKQKIENNEIKSDHLIEFNDSEKKTVKILGQNSMYIFYVSESDTTITIVPINNNIKEIKKIKKP